MTRKEFLTALDQYLVTMSASEKADIISDYEEHFRVGLENGKTESEIAASLGSPYDVANQFLDGTKKTAAAAPVSRPATTASQDYATAQPRPTTAASQGYTTAQPRPAATTSQGYTTAQPRPAATTSQGYATAQPRPATAASQGYATAQPRPATAPSQGYATAQPRPAATASQGYATAQPRPAAPSQGYANQQGYATQQPRPSVPSQGYATQQGYAAQSGYATQQPSAPQQNYANPYAAHAETPYAEPSYGGSNYGGQQPHYPQSASSQSGAYVDYDRAAEERKYEPKKQSESKFNSTGLIMLIVLCVLLIPTVGGVIVSLMMSLYGAVIGFATAGGSLIAVGTAFSAESLWICLGLIFIGISFLALTGLLIMASVEATKLVVKLVKYCIKEGKKLVTEGSF